MHEVNIVRLATSDRIAIEEIADWYLNEWEVPRDVTVARLTTQSPDDVLFHFIVSSGDKPIATGGLHKKVGILKIHPRLENLGPWVALVYTIPEYRKRGIGELLLTQIEKEAKQTGFRKIFLYTYTAESLYRKCGWQTVERLAYKGQECALMEKEI